MNLSKTWWKGFLCVMFVNLTLSTHSQTKNLSQRDAQLLQNEVASLKPKLDEFHQGKRSDSDGLFLLWRIMADMNSLGQMDTPEWKSMLDEWKALRAKRPEFTTHPPMALEESKQVQQKAELDRQQRDQELAAKRASPFTPKDTKITAVLGYDQHAVFVYQYRVEFFNLPPDMKLTQERPGSPVRLYNQGKTVSPRDTISLNLQPFKTITFKHRIQSSDGWSGPLKNFVWVCDDVLSQYTGADDEEELILGNKARTWMNESAEHSNFCGALSLDGKILYQLPIKQHAPDTAIKVFRTNSDGTTVWLEVGEVVEGKITDKDTESEQKPGTRYQYIGNYREILLYTYPDKLETFNINETDKIASAFKSHGLKWHARNHQSSR